MTAEQQTVSVIVPIFDVEAYLEQCIDSVLEQTHALLEVILVDDGSTDGSGLLCDAFADRDSRVRVIHQSNAGLSAARNAGLAAASGDFVTFLDADDWWDPTFVASLLAPLEAHQGAGIAMSTFARVPGAAWVPPVGGTRLLSPGEAIDLFAGPHHTLFTISCAKLFRRDLLDDVRFPEGRLHEDEFTTYRILLRSPTVLLPRPLYSYRQRSTGIVASPLTPERLLDAVHAAEQQVTDLRAAGHDPAAAWATGQSLRKRMRLIALLRSSGRSQEAAEQAALLRRAAHREGGWGESSAFRVLGLVARRSPDLAVRLFTSRARWRHLSKRAAGWVRRST